jgi:formate dehydrogenase subunit beta
MTISSEELQANIKKLFEEGTIDRFIGYEAGSDSLHTTPCFLKKDGQVSRLVWSPLCPYNLSKYLLEFRDGEGRTGILVKGCDARSVVELLKQNQITRDEAFIVGIPCTGQADPDKLLEVTGASPAEITAIKDEGDTFSVTVKGKTQKIDKKKLLSDKCLVCRYPTPPLYDTLLGEAVDSLPWVTDDYALVKEQESLPSEEKAAHWNNEFSQCIRCYACRNICPVCTCKECIFDKKAPRWLTKSTALSENLVYHLIRAFHVAGRCVDCGECERACPMNIPLRSLNKKVEKDVMELFDYTSGVDVDQPAPLATYQTGDLEEFL